ncbi:hypothetical protein QYE76_070925 [Lolium multiflorum]|uniref:GRF-type domain-containing protein n=1 Tax=Lolium multiflorum TaxID=4521 RepID=A0AAD8WEX4_LOLMU|nr:hypothetical protein QYE76_070925 [Lolium multiflorum]
MACSASSHTSGAGGNAPPGGNGGPDANAQMPLIPCPFCGSQISTAVSRKGTRPGSRYYKCRFFGSGKCPFFEWREEYADRFGGNPPPLQDAGMQAAAHQDHQHLARLNLVTWTMVLHGATILYRRYTTKLITDVRLRTSYAVR